VHFGLVGLQAREHAAEPHRVLHQRRSHRVVAGIGGVALVEHEIDDFTHRYEAVAALGSCRDFEGDAGFGERTLRSHDPLRDRRLGGQERTRDLVGGEAAEQTQRQRDSRLARQHGMTRDEHQPQQVIADVVEHRFEVRGAWGIVVATDLGVLALEHLRALQMIERSILRGRDEPRGWVVGDPRGRPGLERGDERILRELLGHADVTHHPRDDRDDLRPLESDDRLDLAHTRMRAPARRAG